jgi:integrase
VSSNRKTSEQLRSYRYRCMSHATLNRVTQIVSERAKAAGLPIEPFTVHDLRRTAAKCRRVWLLTAVTGLGLG